MNPDDTAHPVNSPASEVERLVEENRKLRVRLENVLRQGRDWIEQAEERYRNVFEHSGDAIFCMNPNGIVVDWNSAAERLYGYGADEIMGRSIGTLWPAGDQEQPGNFLQTLERGVTIQDRESWCQRKDGTRVRVSLTSAPVLDEERRIVGASVIVRDVTSRWEERDRFVHHQAILEAKVRDRTRELERANEDLIRQDRTRSLFIASMSHELRTPLNSVIGFTDLLLSGMSGDVTAEQEKQIRIVHNAGYHLLAVINDIIDIAKVEAGQLTVNEEEFAVGPMVQEAIDMSSTKIDPDRVDLVVDAEPLTLRSDARRVKQILVNMLTNAIKFTSQGTIYLSVRRDGERVVIGVQDTGCGMAPEDIEKLFQPFQRLGNMGNQPGTGLGLHLSQRLAELLGGKISVESTPGVGSRFTLTLPQEPPPRESGGG